MTSNYEIGYENPDTGIENPPIEQGSTFELFFTIVLPSYIMVNFLEGRVIDGALDAGTSLRAQYRNPLSSPTNTAFVGTVTKVSNTTLACKLVMDSAKTAALTPGKGFWDCELVNDDAVPYVFKPFGAGNRCRVNGEATR